MHLIDAGLCQLDSRDHQSTRAQPALFLGRDLEGTKSARDLSSSMMISLRLSGRKCVVIGDGPEAERRSKLLRDKGASVRVLSLDATNEPLSTGQLSAYLLGAVVVIAAGVRSDLVRVIRTVTDELGILFCSIDDPENCDFFNVATRSVGPLTLAVSSDGELPCYTSLIADRLLEVLSEYEWTVFRVVKQIREAIRLKHGTSLGNSWRELILEAESLAESGLAEAEIFELLLNQVEITNSAMPQLS